MKKKSEISWLKVLLSTKVIIRLALLGVLICLVLYLGIERSPKYPKTVENLEFLGIWTLEKHEFDRLIPHHPLLKLYYKEHSGIPIFIEAIEWYDNKFKLWNGAQHNVYYQEKHKRYVIKDVN